jgi:HlyD family secretion protein
LTCVKGRTRNFVHLIFMRRALAIIVLIAALLAAGVGYFRSSWTGTGTETPYRFAVLDRGNIVATVNAAGTITPITTVIVGSQLSGQVVEILADFNSAVTAGQVVARLNSDQIRARLDAASAELQQVRANKLMQEAQVEHARAEVQRGRASVADAEAQLARNEALLGDAEANFKRQAALRAHGPGYTAEATYDTARAQRDAQLAVVASARAQIASAKAQLMAYEAQLNIATAQLAAVIAQVAQREAVVRQIGVDLSNTEIRSPVSGLVIQRNIELGQTVAASLQSPTLFLIADDLRRMEIAASIDETDVGRVKADQMVAFTVNAYPGRTFAGKVKQVRLGSQTVQNVVIYTAIISVENPRLELMPGMTANLRIETQRLDNVVRIPNAALRWRPPASDTAAPPATTETPADTPRRPRQAAFARLFDDFEKAIKQELELSREQAQEIDAAFVEARQLVGSFDRGTEPTARRERLRGVREHLESRIGAVLTAEQRPQFEAIRQKFAEVGVGRGTSQTARVYVLVGNKPEAVSIRVGPTDGAFTQVLAGLDVGKQVIIGGGPRPDPTVSQPQFGPRFGL